MATLAIAAQPNARPIARRVQGLLRRLAAATALYRQRRALARLDTRALRDIGVTTGAAHVEAARPVWDMPSNWPSNWPTNWLR